MELFFSNVRPFSVYSMGIVVPRNLMCDVFFINLDVKKN